MGAGALPEAQVVITLHVGERVVGVNVANIRLDQIQTMKCSNRGKKLPTHSYRRPRRSLNKAQTFVFYREGRASMFK